VSLYRQCIDDPDHIALLEGQRYVVLRPTGVVPDVYNQIRTAVKGKLAGLPVSYPAQPHVMLTGFPKGTPLEAVRELVSQWAPTIPRLRIEVEGVSFFPIPFQIVIVRVRTTADLFHALSSLRDLSKGHGLGDLPTTAPADWIFHMSVAYCSTLSASAWADVTHFIETLHTPPAQCIVGEVEVVAFDDGQEYSGGVLELAARTSVPESAV
jgi:hypothetical protein